MFLENGAWQRSVRRVWDRARWVSTEFGGYLVVGGEGSGLTWLPGRAGAPCIALLRPLPGMAQEPAWTAGRIVRVADRRVRMKS